MVNKVIISSPNKMTKDVIKGYPNFLFVLGNTKLDNSELNTYGNTCILSMKKSEGRDGRAFWKSEDYDKFCNRIDKEFSIIRNHLEKGALLVLPSEDVSKFDGGALKYIPKHKAYLQNKIESVIVKYGKTEAFNF